MKLIILWIAILSALAERPFLNGQTPVSKPTREAQRDTSPPETPQLTDRELLIANGDLLEVQVVGTDFTCGGEKTTGCQVRVSRSGQISLPFIGLVRVSGLTVTEAEQLIAERLSKGEFMNNPQVTVVQKEASAQDVSVLGEVQKPGTYPLRGSPTLLEAIATAGGTTVKAGNEVSIIHRDLPNSPKRVELNAPQVGTMAILPGDTVIVSKAGIVYVVGDVHHPSGVVMENGRLTVLQAIAMAEGTKPTAALNRAMLIRSTPEGRQSIPIPLGKMLANQSEDPRLRPEDIVFVPSSAVKSVTSRMLEAAVQTATGLAIYRP